MKFLRMIAGVITALVMMSCGDEPAEKETVDPDGGEETIDNVEITVPLRFEHPGILHTQADLNHLKEIANDPSHPGYKCYEQFAADSHSKADYTLQGPFESLYRGSADGKPSIQGKYESDFNASFQNAVMWTVTGDESHAVKAAEILKAYARKVTTINDDVLLAGIMGVKFVYAAEVMTHTYAQGFTNEEIKAIKNMFENIFLPVLNNFMYTSAYSNGNWGASVCMSKAAIGIFLDNQSAYRAALNFFLTGKDNGTLRNYISNKTGQCQESGRDQAHTQLGLSCLAVTCELAYKQGMDLYKVDNNRLMRGLEYTARYNNGYEVPFETWTDLTGKYCNWTVISDKERGKLRPVWYMPYNHYVNRKGLSMPETGELLDQKLNPETYYYEHFGFGQFLFNDK